jgi:hypothetical protein
LVWWKARAYGANAPLATWALVLNVLVTLVTPLVLAGGVQAGP